MDARSDTPARGAPTSRRAARRGLRREPVAWILVAIAGLVAIQTAWWLTGIDRDLSRGMTSVAGIPAALFGILGAIALGRDRRLDRRTRSAWALIALGLVSYGIAGLIRLVSVGTLGGDVPQGLLTALELTTYVVFIPAIVMLPKPTRSLHDPALFALDVAIVAWTATMLLWHFLFFPLARSAGQGTGDAVAASLFPVADMALAFLIAGLVTRGLRRSTRAALSVAVLAIILLFCADLLRSVDLLQGDYVPGGLAGVLYSMTWTLLAVSVFLQWYLEDHDEVELGLSDYSRVLPWVPALAAPLAILAPAIRDWNDQQMLQQQLAETALLILLLVARLAVTARRSASRAAAERERLVAAVEQASEAILTCDPAGRISYANPAVAAVTGYSAAELMTLRTQALDSLTDDSDRRQIVAAMARGQKWAGRTGLRRKDGRVVELDISVAPLRDAGAGVVGSIVVAKDISHERALEVQLAQAQRAEAVGRLAGGIAHDFNNLLTAIHGFGELALATLAPRHPARSDVSEMLKAADRAADLTRALLAFSRRQTLQPSVVNLNDIVEGLVPMLKRTIGEDIELDVRTTPELGLIWADPSQIDQVLMNLVLNARDAMDGGGRLTVSTSNSDLDQAAAMRHVDARAGSWVRLAVGDTGTGMTGDVLEHAFEPFFTTKSLDKGTGLGLSTVMGVVQQSDGFLTVESAPGAGTTVEIYLPRVQTDARPAVAPAALPAAGGGHESILLVEDEDAVRTLASRVLAEAGYRVYSAPDGVGALRLADTLPEIDLLLTDMVMPGMNGAELARRLGERWPEMPLAFMSGYSDGPPPGDHGHEVLLLKPFTVPQLLAHVRRVLDDRDGDDLDGTRHDPRRAPTPRD